MNNKETHINISITVKGGDYYSPVTLAHISLADGGQSLTPEQIKCKVDKLLMELSHRIFDKLETVKWEDENNANI